VTYRYWHIGVIAVGPPDPKVLEPYVKSICADWVRYGAGAWIIWSDKSGQQIYDAIRFGITADQQVLVVKVDLSDMQGWLPKWIWDWLNYPRSNVPAASWASQNALAGLGGASQPNALLGPMFGAPLKKNPFGP
jgi:hypothetical protein